MIFQRFFFWFSFCRLAILLVVAFGIGACTQEDRTADQRPDSTALEPKPKTTLELSDDTEVTFSKHIAPIVVENCVTCHRPGASAPFSLLTYDDVRERARQIARVTESRFMPPWLPERGEIRFVAERRLSETEIETIRRWVDAGAPEGDRRDLPPVPTFASDWQLGPPDLIVKLEKPYTLPASSEGDVYRNFVMPLPLSRRRNLRGLEVRPGNPRVVHHAILGVDRTTLSQSLDRATPEPGYGDMDSSGSQMVDGQIFAWTPGKEPQMIRDGMAARVYPNSDLVIQLHMVPSGKPETIQPQIGLYFTDERPKLFPWVFIVDSHRIDIPAGKKDYLIEESFVTPVDVDVMTVYPHAHYLGKDMHGFLILPNGAKKTLIHIKDWDFNWQTDYQFVKPNPVPAGSKIVMRYTYDNSSDNVRNPNSPPKRVKIGNRSSDEMGQLILQVLPRNEADRTRLQLAFFRYKAKLRPRTWEAHSNLAKTLGQEDQFDEAIASYETAVALAPKYADLHDEFARLLEKAGKFDRAERHYVRATRLSPGFAVPYDNYGRMLARLGRDSEAEVQFQLSVKADPAYHLAHNDLGFMALKARRVEDAKRHFETAIRLRPDYAEAHFHLTEIYLSKGDMKRALVHAGVVEVERPEPPRLLELATAFSIAGAIDEAIRILTRVLQRDNEYGPAYAKLGYFYLQKGDHKKAVEYLESGVEFADDPVDAYVNLGSAFAQGHRYDEAISYFEKALNLRPNDMTTLHNLGVVAENQGQLLDAVEYYRRAAATHPGIKDREHFQITMKLARILATSANGAVRDGKEAVRLAERCAKATQYRHPGVLDTLAAAYADVGNFKIAVRWQKKAVDNATEEMRAALETRLQLYQTGKPYRESARK